MLRDQAALLATSLVTAACGGAPAELEAQRAEITLVGLDHEGPDAQFHPSFRPAAAPFGGFGGGTCVPRRTPVIFLPGNGDPAKNWDFPPSTGGRSTYETFLEEGWRPCELFGLDYLTAAERAEGGRNYHRPEKAELVARFIVDVLAYTGASEVDVIGHSLGVTMALEAIRAFELESRVRRFVAISAGLRGLSSCLYAGPANPLLPTCGSRNYFERDVFGFHPDVWWARNPRMGNGGFRDDPRRAPGTRFYSIRAGLNDQVHCTTATYYPSCGRTATFDAYDNVVSQLDVGDGSTAGRLDFDFSSDWSPFVLGAGDADGVGHFRAKNNTGLVQTEILGTACAGAACCGRYAGRCD